MEIPTHIEKYLSEADFNPTEIFIVKNLIGGAHATLRELAKTTGKSTGVLAQACKKLMQKNVLIREFVNETPKYAIPNPRCIYEWIKKEMEIRHVDLRRQESDFSSFIDSISSKRGRPKMEYYEDEEGMKKAYVRLLKTGGELLQLIPSHIPKPNDEQIDPRSERYELQRKYSMFSRTITYDDPIGRRLKSRDPFERRETTLVPEGHYSLGFEKIISGDTVGCFDHVQNKACLILFPEFAEAEKRTFEMIWRLGKIKETLEKILGKSLDDIPDETNLRKGDILHIASVIIAKEEMGWVKKTQTMISELHRTFLVNAFSLSLIVILTEIMILPRYQSWISQFQIPITITQMLPLIPILLITYYLFYQFKNHGKSLRDERWVFVGSFILNLVSFAFIAWQTFSFSKEVQLLPIVLLLSLFGMLFVYAQSRRKPDYTTQIVLQAGEEHRLILNKQKLLGLVLRIIAIVIWGTTPIIARYGLEDIPAAFSLGFAYIIASILLTPFAIYRFVRDKTKMAEKVTSSYQPLFWIAIVGHASSGLFILLGAKHTLASNTELFLNFAPVIALLVSFIFLKEKIPYLKSIKYTHSIFGATLIGLLGTACLIIGDVPSIPQKTKMVGDIISLLALITDVIGSFALILYAKQKNSFSVIDYITRKAWLISAFLMPVTIWYKDIVLSLTSTQWLSILSFAFLDLFIATIFGYLAFKWLDGLIAYLLLTLSAIVTIAIEVTFFGMPLSPIFIVGTVLIILSAITAATIKSQSQKATLTQTA